MGLFEKISFEPIEIEDAGETPRSTRQWAKNETFTVEYFFGKKWLLFIYPFVFLPVALTFLEEGFFPLEMAAVGGIIFGICYVIEPLTTRDITFSPEGIVRRGTFGRTVIPAGSLLMKANSQCIRFFHGTRKNFRESVPVHRYLIEAEEAADILKYAEDVYHVSANAKLAGTTREGKGSQGSLALQEYRKAASSYLLMSLIFVLFVLVALFTVGLTGRFYGLAPALPSLPVRLACIALATGGFLMLRRLKTEGRGSGTAPLPLEVRLKKMESAAFIPAVAAGAMGCLGLVLLLLFGNRLDFYLFMLVGVLCFYDYYPRLSAWEDTVGETPAEAAKEASSLTPRRSLQISLVLMGALAVASQGESRHYIYNSRQDCLEDWGGGQDCREAPPGSSHYGTHTYYGPRYGSGTGRAPRSIGVGTVSRGGFGSFGSFHASFGG
ncbi:MAG TPA: hypothetical protein VF799_12080 [Geobacteraceae bacterium]